MKFRFPAATFLGALLLPILARPAFPVSVSSTTHPSFVTRDFNSEKIPFVAYQREGGVASGARFELRNGTLNISNDYAGSFGVSTKTEPFDAEKYSHLVFDYALNPDVKVNIFFRLRDNGLYHGAIFSGPKVVRAGSVLLGQIPGVVADGKWHRAEIPLRDWLRKLYPTKTSLMIDEITIGNWDNNNYLMALGVGGNGVGANWNVDNFSVTGVGPAEAKFTFKDDGGGVLARPSEYSYSLDGGPATPLFADQLTLSPGAGFHFLQILNKDKKPAGSYGFYVADGAPRIGKPELRDNILRVPIESGAGLNTANLKLTVGDRAFQIDSPFLSWDGATSTLALQAADAGLRWNDKQQVAVTLDGVQDILGTSTSALKTNVEVEFSKHKMPPPLPELESLQAMGSGTFENSLDEWAAKTDSEGAAVVERDSETAASGAYSVRMTASVNAGSFANYIRRTAFDVAKFPVIEFDYKIPPELRVDFVFDWGGQTYSVGFTDRTPQWTRIGSLPDIIADGKWHHAQLRLFDLMRASRPGAADFQVNWLSLSDSGWQGNGKGLRYWIDNFQFVPVEPGAPFKSKVLAPDVTGIKSISWALDDSARTEIPTTSKTTGEIQVSGSGAKWLHVRVENGAGQWSPTSHVPVLLDTSPPQIGASIPANGTRAASPEISIALNDDTGVDFSSINLNLQGREYSLRDPAFVYEPGRLVFSLADAVKAGQLAPLDDGATLTWKLAPVRDVAGQVAPAVEGNWTYDFAQDKTGPIAALSSPTHTILALSPGGRTRLRGAPAVANLTNESVEFWQGENLQLAAGTRDDRPGQATLRATAPTANAPFVLRLPRPLDITRYPLFGFAYKIPAGQNLFLRMRTGNTVTAIKFLGEAQGTVIGEIPNAVADGQWHWAQINFGALKEKIGGAAIGMLEFVDASSKVPANTVLEFDDFTFQQAPAGNVKLNWWASDLSGVKDFRFAWDQNPLTNPTEATAEKSRDVAPSTGTWWAHIQAQDRVGNWGAVAHLPILFP